MSAERSIPRDSRKKRSITERLFSVVDIATHAGVFAHSLSRWGKAVSPDSLAAPPAAFKWG